jgi:hypothetical protein
MISCCCRSYDHFRCFVLQDLAYQQGLIGFRWYVNDFALSRKISPNFFFRTIGQFRKAVIRPQDVLWPLGILLGANLIILTTWTAVAPLTWERPILIDEQLGPWRGSCYHFDAKTDPMYAAKITFASLLMGINLLAMLMTNYQFYLARKLPSQFNETTYIGMTNVVLFESVFAGVPILATLNNDPATFVAVLCLILCFCCMGKTQDTYSHSFTFYRRHTLTHYSQVFSFPCLCPR